MFVRDKLLLHSRLNQSSLFNTHYTRARLICVANVKIITYLSCIVDEMMYK